MNSDETLEKAIEKDVILQAIAELSKKIEVMKKNNSIQFESIRQGIVDNSARFDQLEALALDAKSIALIARSQLTILTEEIRNNRKVLA